MSELYDILVETPPAKVILLALDQGLWDCERSLAELSALCEANHMEAVAEVTQKRQTPETGIVLGSGKLEEAHLAAEERGAVCAVFDGELTGSQIRNISTALGGLEVIDRTMLILEIFRSRAVTNEGTRPKRPRPRRLQNKQPPHAEGGKSDGTEEDPCPPVHRLHDQPPQKGAGAGGARAQRRDQHRPRGQKARPRRIPLPGPGLPGKGKEEKGAGALL